MRNTAIALAVILVLALGLFFISRSNNNSQNQPAVNQTTQQAPSQAVSPTVMSPSISANPSGSPVPSSAAMQDGKEITVVGNEFSFQPSTLNLKQGDKVLLVFKNEGKYPHNLAIPDLKVTTKTIQPGQSDMINFTVDKGGNYAFVCTVDSHEQKGMKGTVNVQ